MNSAGHGCEQRFASVGELRHLLGGQDTAQWLAPVELDALAGLNDCGRRLLWLGGRYLAKELLCEWLLPGGDGRLDPRSLVVQSQDAQGRTGKPRVYLRGKLQPWSLSIAHSRRAVAVACTAEPRQSVGVDLVDLTRFSASGLSAWFTPSEKRWIVGSETPHLVAEIWAVKEAFYKADNRARPFAPRKIEVSPREGGGCACRWTDQPADRPYRIWTRRVNNQLHATVLALPPWAQCNNRHAVEHRSPVLTRNQPEMTERVE